LRSDPRIPSISPEELQILYTEGLEAFYLKRWEIAVEKFERVVTIQPTYEDISTKLTEARRLLEIQELFAKSNVAWSVKMWRLVIDCLEKILAIDPANADALSRLQEARRLDQVRNDVEYKYKDALKAIDAKQWQNAKTLLEQILKVNAGFRETRQLYESVNAEWRKNLSQKITGKDGKEMILIPAGEFLMGRNDEEDNEKPLHKVYLDAFYISRYPVTQAEYKQFVDATNRAVPFLDADWAKPYNWDEDKRTYPVGKANHPVVLELV